MSSKYYPLVKGNIKGNWPGLYHEMPMSSALKALWKTPRVYYNGKELIDPQAELVYGSLRNGLDPEAIKPRPMNDSDIKEGIKQA